MSGANYHRLICANTLFAASDYHPMAADRKNATANAR